MKDLSDVKHDIVLDTCTLAHSCNAQAAMYASASNLVRWFVNADGIRWVLDDNGKRAPEVSTSVLYSQYIATLPPQSLPLILLARCLSSGRVAFVSRPDRRVRELIRRLVPANKSDQVVLGAAAMSKDQFLVSNDLRDFSAKVRRLAEKQLGVTITTSEDLAYE